MRRRPSMHMPIRTRVVCLQCRDQLIPHCLALLMAAAVAALRHRKSFGEGPWIGEIERRLVASAPFYFSFRLCTHPEKRQ